MIFLKTRAGLYWSLFHRRLDSSGSTPESPVQDNNPVNPVQHWIHLDPCEPSDYLGHLFTSMVVHRHFHRLCYYIS